MNRPADEAEISAADEPPGADASSQRRRSKPRRFVYKTGDRPLDGYTIRRGIGQGGFGEVYFATSDAGKEVALKLLRRNLDVELRGVRQCLNLKHPNLIGLYDIRSDSMEDEWVVMEYVSGESLEQVLERSPEGVGPEQAVAWIRGVAAGVGCLHNAGIVHRDLKPGNLFNEAHCGAEATPESVKVGDYGLAKFISASRRSGQTESVGTVHYMAPEIAGGRYGREIDTYALGVILYELLTGNVPFDGESAGEVLMKHLTAEPELKGVDPRFHAVIQRALAKDPETRLGSIDEFLALLPRFESAADGEPVLVETPAAPQPGVWSPVSASPHEHATTSSREPLWEGMVDLIETSRNNWREWRAPPLAKGLAIFVIIAAAFSTSAVWLGAVVAILPLYLVYYIIWSAFLQEPPKPAPGAQRVGPNGRAVGKANLSSKPNAKRSRRHGWRDAARKRLLERTGRQRLKSLVGSMLMAALVAGFACGIAAPLLAQANDGGAPIDVTALGLWMGVVATLGSWGLLVGNALTEARIEDNSPRRGYQLVLGVVLGLAAAGVAGTLGLDLPYLDDAGFLDRSDQSLLNEAFGIDLYQGVTASAGKVAVPVAASVIYFGIVFLLIRWWRSAEYIRHRRIGFWSIAGACFGAWILSIVAWYPQPMGVVLAGVIALATQAASPWLPPSERVALARKFNSTV